MKVIVLGLIGLALLVVGVLVYNTLKTPGSATRVPAPTSTSNPSTSLASGAGNSETKEAAIRNFAFSPATLTVKKGIVVKFTNFDSANHTVTAVDGSFDTKSFGQDESQSLTFAKTGEFAYYCKIHPSMKGTIVVTE